MIKLVKMLQLQTRHHTIQNDELNCNLLDDNNKYHDRVLNDTISVSKSFIFIGFTGDLQLSLVIGIWILFAQTLHGYNGTIIAFVVLLQQILKLIMILFTSYLCDKYGFDKTVIATSSCIVVSTFLFSISMNIYLIIFAVIIESMAGHEVEVIGLAWISKMLPHKHASIYTSFYIAFTSIAYCVGVSLGGIISQLTNDTYRYTFYVAFILSSIRWIFILIKIRNKQKHLINQQMRFIEYYENEQNLFHNNSNNKEIEKLRFPICVDMINSKYSINESYKKKK
eukprot:361459_1